VITSAGELLIGIGGRDGQFLADGVGYLDPARLGGGTSTGDFIHKSRIVDAASRSVDPLGQERDRWH
jgi:hypothetical protein